MLVCSDELDRPENKDMKSLVDKLATAKKTVDDKGKIAGQLCAGPHGAVSLLHAKRHFVNESHYAACSNLLSHS